METESIKMCKYQQMKVLKEQTNVHDHEQKLKAIEFTASTHQCGKTKEQKKESRSKVDGVPRGLQ